MIDQSPVVVTMGLDPSSDSRHEQVVNDLLLRIPNLRLAYVPSTHQPATDLLALPFTQAEANRANYGSVLGLSASSMTSSLYSLARSFEGEALRMMDRLVLRRGRHPYGISFDDRRAMFFEHCSFWYSYLIERRVNHILFIDVPHEPSAFVLYSLACQLQLKTLILFHEKSGLAQRDGRIRRLGTEREPSSLDTHRFFAASSIVNIAGRKLRNVPRVDAETHNELAMPSSLLLPRTYSDGQVADVAVARQRKSLLASWIETQRRRLKYGLHLTVANTLARVYQRRWMKFLVRHGTVPGPSEEFALYYLAYQPEASTSPRAGVFVEQFIGVQLAAHALKGRLPLYVREHPDQFSRRRSRQGSLVAALAKREGFRLLKPGLSSDWCLERAALIIGPPGSMGIAAWRRGIPLIQLGASVLTSAPGVMDESYLIDLRDGKAEFPPKLPLADESKEARERFLSDLALDAIPGGPLTGTPLSRHLDIQLIRNVTDLLADWLTEHRPIEATRPS